VIEVEEIQGAAVFHLPTGAAGLWASDVVGQRAHVVCLALAGASLDVGTFLTIVVPASLLPARQHRAEYSRRR
jgi:hypothetical protein